MEWINLALDIHFTVSLSHLMGWGMLCPLGKRNSVRCLQSCVCVTDLVVVL
jgi:hypothetical protein